MILPCRRCNEQLCGERELQQHWLQDMKSTLTRSAMQRQARTLPIPKHVVSDRPNIVFVRIAILVICSDRIRLAVKVGR